MKLIFINSINNKQVDEHTENKHQALINDSTKFIDRVNNNVFYNIFS